MTTKFDTLIRDLSTRVADCQTPWELPWRVPTALPMNASTGHRYRGVNLLNLSLRAFERGYGRADWLTFRQAIALGGCVRKGETGTKIILMKPLPMEEGERDRYVWRVWTVFNVAQIEGLDLPDRILPSTDYDRTHGKHALCRAFLASLDAPVEHMECTPCYIPAFDRINLPHEAAFIDTRHLTASQSYLATLLHEHIHATGHSSRLGRFGTSVETGNAYAFEELIAEIGSALLARMLGLETEVSESHVAYLSHWQSRIDDDPTVLARAASAAEKAMACLVEQAGMDIEPVLPGVNEVKDMPLNRGMRVKAPSGAETPVAV